MKPVYQTKFGGSDSPESEQGNCLAAALASIFEVGLDDVPDFQGHIVDHSWYPMLQEWLGKRNLVMCPVSVKDGAPRGIHIMTVKSTTLPNPDDGHVVVIENGNLIHDPNPNATKLGDAQQYWVFACLNPALQGQS